MTDADSSNSIYSRLLNCTGRWYPLLALLGMQLINTPLMILLTSMPAQQNGEFNRAQGLSLLLLGSIALVFRNALLLFQFYLFNKDVFKRLTYLYQSDSTTDEDPEQEKRAWKQINSAARRYILAEFVMTVILVMIPLLIFGYHSLQLSYTQIIYLILSALAANLVNLITENLIFAQWFKPVIIALLPRQFETQLIGLKGLRLWEKLTLAIMGLVLISLLLTVPTAYHQVYIVYTEDLRSPEDLKTALLLIINSGVGAVVVGALLCYRMVFYFSTPFRKMIALFKKVEAGDLKQRIEVTYTDEFGEINIYLNRMISRLQKMTSSLEQKVVERTEQLVRTNDQLQIELTERKRVEEQLAYNALHDPLTDLPNRALLLDRLRQAMERFKRHKNFRYAVIFLDLDRFKVINDSLGHNVGDLMLIESAHRLVSCVRSEDTVARLGGDEFVILLEGLEDSKVYIQIVNRIQQELSKPAVLGDHNVFTSISMGIVLDATGYGHPDEILRDADIAMYRAKRMGRGRFEIFDQSMLDGAMSRLEMETELRKAMEEKEFILHYQPIHDLENNRIIGFEALVRWKHPERGIIPPEDFIPLAEETGLIVPMGYWILNEACRQIRSWQIEYPSKPALTMNVNFSTRQFTDMNLVEKIVEILDNNNLEAGSLKMELTESLIVEDSESTSITLMKLNELGIQVHIDDFGTGYSSLGYLHKLPIDTLKIDRTFISRLGSDASGSEIVQTIMALAHGLGMQVIAEGVETDEQLSELKSMHCDYVQGFLLAKPVDNMEAGQILDKSFSSNK